MSDKMSHYTRYYLHESTEPMVVDRFIDELGWYAYFIGSLYNRQDTFLSLQRIWSRYFGPAIVPANFVDAYHPSLKLVGLGASRAFPLTRESGQVAYSWGPAIHELVATAMFRRWYYYRDGCSIPFEYPGLVDAYLTPNGPPYMPRFRKLFSFYFINFVSLFCREFTDIYLHNNIIFHSYSFG